MRKKILSKKGWIGVGLTLAGLKFWLNHRHWFDLSNRIVAITGGSRGLGLVLAREFGRKGAKIAMAARDEVELARAADDLARRGVDVLTYLCDVTVQVETESFIAKVEEDWGPIDVFVNNAGVIQVSPLEDTTIADFEGAMKTHFWGALYGMTAVLRRMKRRHAGRVVNIASIGGKISVPHLLPYCSSKFALVGLSEGIRNEVAKDGIFVTTVCPGLMRTGSPLNADFKGKYRDEYALFTILDSLPGTSVSAESAARQIVRACQRGDAECIVGFSAKLAAQLAPLFPGITAEIFSFLNRLLPHAGGIGRSSAKGHDGESAWAPSPLTRLTYDAAARNNEIV